MRTVYPGQDPMSIELKAATLLNRRQFERSPQRQAMVAEVVNLLESNAVSIFGIRMRRPVVKPAWPAPRVDPPSRLLTERIELHMRAHHPGRFAKLVFDETSRGTDAARSAAMRTYMHSTEEGRSWLQILDVPFFVSSSNTPGIQLADIMAGAMRHYQILRDSGFPASPWTQAIVKLQRLAEGKSEDITIDKRTFHGLYTMPDSYFANPPRRGRL
jgi:hypothetical protein